MICISHFIAISETVDILIVLKHEEITDSLRSKGKNILNVKEKKQIYFPQIKIIFQKINGFQLIFVIFVTIRHLACRCLIFHQQALQYNNL